RNRDGTLSVVLPYATYLRSDLVAAGASATAPGPSLLHAPIVASVIATAGRRTATSSATRMIGASRPSSRPIQMGPRAARNASQNQTAARPCGRARPSSATATASASVTRILHAQESPSVGDESSAGTSLGPGAPSGHTQS